MLTMIAGGAAVVGYVRVSTSGQEAQGLSLPEQARRIQEWCDHRGYNLLAVFMDAESGAGFEKRVGFQSARAYTMDGTNGCTGLVVFNFDRYAREAGWSEVIRKELIDRGRGLYSVEENFDLNDMYGIFSFQIRMSVAELVRKQTIHLMHQRRLAKKARGGWHGHRPPYGFRAERTELVVDEQEQRLIVTGLWLRHRGWGYQEIAYYFDAWFKKDPEKYGGPKWTKLPQRPRITPTRRNYRKAFNRSSIWAILNPWEQKLHLKRALTKALVAQGKLLPEAMDSLTLTKKERSARLYYSRKPANLTDVESNSRRRRKENNV